MAVGIKRRIRAALVRVSASMQPRDQADKFERGLASEGYVGGYADALRDVELLLRGVEPNRRDYWKTKN